MNQCKNYKKIIICGNVSLVIALWAYIFIAYIAWNRISTFFRQFYSEDLANFVGSIIIFFINAALFIRWFDQIVALPRWVLLLLSYSIIDNQKQWHLLSPSFLLPSLLPLFFCHKFRSVLFIETFALSWEIALGSFLKVSS